MASSFKCPWGVKAQFTIPFKSLFYYHADKGVDRCRKGDDYVLQQICYFKGHSARRGHTEPGLLHSSRQLPGAIL